MALPIEETNLGGIGSEEDTALRQTVAKMDFKWEGAGSSPGVEIWRVENKRYEDGNPSFGIHLWPTKRHGQFHRGDSYIVLMTTKEDDCERLQWDIFFWIGGESSQDEYGVAAYKANELDDLLGGVPVQHREVEGNESEEFLKCFPKGISYLEGGIESGFRQVEGLDEDDEIKRLYRVQKKPPNLSVSCFEVPLKCSSLNDGDAFLLDAGDVIYSWFGSSVSPFEKNKVATVCHNLREERLGRCEVISDVDDDNGSFWELLGGKEEIKPATKDEDNANKTNNFAKMYTLSDADGVVGVKEVPLAKDALVSKDVCLVDVGKNVFVWIGKESSKNEQQQAMLTVNRYLKAMDRNRTTCVSRVLEGQEHRCKTFLRVFE